MLNAQNSKNFSFTNNSKRGKLKNLVFIYAIPLTAEISKLLPRINVLRGLIIYVGFTTYIPSIFSFFLLGCDKVLLHR